MEITYRLVALGDEGNVGQTGATPEIAKMIPGNLSILPDTRLGIERTDWSDSSGKLRPVRSVIIDVESSPKEWKIGF